MCDINVLLSLSLTVIVGVYVSFIVISSIIIIIFIIIYFIIFNNRISISISIVVIVIMFNPFDSLRLLTRSRYCTNGNVLLGLMYAL